VKLARVESRGAIESAAICARTASGTINWMAPAIAKAIATRG